MRWMSRRGKAGTPVGRWRGACMQVLFQRPPVRRRQRVEQAEATADKPYCSRYRPCDARGHRRACRVAPDREPSDLVTIEYRQDLVRKSPTRIARNTIAPTVTNGRDVEQLPTVAQKADPNLILHPPVLADDNQRRSSTAGAVGKPVPVEAETVSVYAHSPMLSAVVRAAPIVLAETDRGRKFWPARRREPANYGKPIGDARVLLAS
jgi:hypothetical protein